MPSTPIERDATENERQPRESQVKRQQGPHVYIDEGGRRREQEGLGADGCHQHEGGQK